jgi:hypothetical protein
MKTVTGGCTLLSMCENWLLAEMYRTWHREVIKKKDELHGAGPLAVSWIIKKFHYIYGIQGIVHKAPPPTVCGR